MSTTPSVRDDTAWRTNPCWCVAPISPRVRRSPRKIRTGGRVLAPQTLWGPRLQQVTKIVGDLRHLMEHTRCDGTLLVGDFNADPRRIVEETSKNLLIINNQIVRANSVGDTAAPKSVEIPALCVPFVESNQFLSAYTGSICVVPPHTCSGFNLPNRADDQMNYEFITTVKERRGKEAIQKTYDKAGNITKAKDKTGVARRMIRLAKTWCLPTLCTIDYIFYHGLECVDTLRKPPEAVLKECGHNIPSRWYPSSQTVCLWTLPVSPDHFAIAARFAFIDDKKRTFAQI